MSAWSNAGVKRALRAYVLGHDSSSSPEVKSRLAEESLRREDRERSASEPVGAGTTNATSPAHRDRASIPVPDRLDFHRSAGRWRDSIPGLKGGGI